MTPPVIWGGVEVRPGQRKRIRFEVGESYTGLSVRLPVMVWRGKEEGPTVLISSAVHGDEINGTGTVRELIHRPPFQLHSGTLVLIPVVNIMGFERHSRYMPDRRDLNRSFPGSESGSLTSRLANLLTTEIISRCDFGIDLHTAAVRRTNFPNVRADMTHPGCARLATAFGCSVIIDQKGPQGSLRNCATEQGCPTIILEAGEVWKVEPLYLETALRGIEQCLIELGMVNKPMPEQSKPRVVSQTIWVRADAGGFLQFHVSPGDVVEKDQILATNYGLLGREQESVHAPCPGIVIGMSTMPAVAPGDPILHIAKLPKKTALKMGEQVTRGEASDQEVRVDLATNVHVVEAPEESV